MLDLELRELGRRVALEPNDAAATARHAAAEFRLGIDPVREWVDVRLRARWHEDLPETGPTDEMLSELEEARAILRALVRLVVVPDCDYARGPRGLMVVRIESTLVIGVLTHPYARTTTRNPAETWGVFPWREWAEEKRPVEGVVAEPVEFFLPKPRGSVKSLDARTEYDRHINRVRRALCATPRPGLADRTAFPLERARLFARLAPLAA